MNNKQAETIAAQASTIVALKEQVATARNDALEEVAGICESRRPASREDCPEHWKAYEKSWGIRLLVANECAAAIRALASQPAAKEAENKDVEWLMQCAEEAQAQPEIATQIRAHCMTAAKCEASQPAAPVQPTDALLKWALRELLTTLPRPRDWLNPEAENVLREALTAPPVQQPDDVLAVHLEAIAANWDGDTVDSVGESIDVGVALRLQFKRLCQALATTRPGAALTTDIREFLEMWTHDGALQTFGSREKFRQEVSAILAASGGDGQVVPGWIPVADRMPEDDADVIVTGPAFGDYAKGRYSSKASFNHGAFYNEDGDEMHDPDHWIAIPATPAVPSHPAKGEQA